MGLEFELKQQVKAFDASNQSAELYKYTCNCVEAELAHSKQTVCQPLAGRSNQTTVFLL